MLRTAPGTVWVLWKCLVSLSFEGDLIGRESTKQTRTYTDHPLVVKKKKKKYVCIVSELSVSTDISKPEVNTATT